MIDLGYRTRTQKFNVTPNGSESNLSINSNVDAAQRRQGVEVRVHAACEDL